MFTSVPNQIQAAEIILGCEEIADTLRFYQERLGFQLDAIFPADDPTDAVVSGYGLRVHLVRGSSEGPGILRLLCDNPKAAARGEGELVAPNGTRIEFVDIDPPLKVPKVEKALVITKNSADAEIITGRAGMRYRDLIPGRLGGHVIASQISIPDAGPVPDNVHFHKVHFQLIYCYKGWVKVLYEDNGPPITLRAGDCFMQPPEIRHRVLESSDGLEVIEVSVPSEHITYLDHEMSLPTPEMRPEREYTGQKFVNHKAATATWTPWRLAGFEARDLEINAGTNGVADVKVARVKGNRAPVTTSHDCPMVFSFVLEGEMKLQPENADAEALAAGDSYVVPADMKHTIFDYSDDLEILEVALPAEFETRIY